MKCSKCQFEVEEEWNYCANCKTPVSGLEYNPFSEKNFIEGSEQCKICATFIKDSWNYCPICCDLKRESEIIIDETSSQEDNGKGFCDKCMQEVYIDDGVCRVCGTKVIKDPFLNSLVRLLKNAFLVVLIVMMIFCSGPIGAVIVIVAGPFLVIGLIVALIFGNSLIKFFNKIKKIKVFSNIYFDNKKQS